MQAKEVYKALANLIPESEQTFNSNFQSLKDDLNDLNKMMIASAKKNEGTALFASHPVYQYLADSYNLNIISFHWEPDIFPNDFEWDRFNSLVKVNPKSLMIWEDEPLQEVKQKIVKSGIRVVVFNPCANKPATGDFISVMKDNILDLSN